MSRFLFTFGLVLSFLISTAQAGVKPPEQQLLRGAETDVPRSAQPPEQLSFVDDGPVHIYSKLTGVDFHVLNKNSSEPGGLSPFPQPILKIANGVQYYFISGELSGYTTNELGLHIVMGPTDANGVSYRDETWCSPCSPDFEDRSLCCEEGQEAPNPRAGLPGAFFALMKPVKGFNGSLVQIEAAGDGGFNLPAAPLLYNPVDPVALLERGYAVFTFGQGGTAPRGLLQNGSYAIDTNPDSGSGIFWQDAGFFDPENALVQYLRLAAFDEDTGIETSLPSDYSLHLNYFFDGEVDVPFGEPRFEYGALQAWNPEIISDTVIFAKNLMRALFPHQPVTWAAYLGWSGSGSGAIEINSNTRGGGFQVTHDVGPQAGGGNYNIWGQPSSGLRYNGFISYASINDFQEYTDRIDGPADVNPQFPITAPFIWFVPEYDATLPQSAGYDYANKVWAALNKLGRGREINDFFRIYSLPKATHQERGQLFAGFDSRDRRGGLWFEYRDILPPIEPFNEQGRGFRVSDPYAQWANYLPPDDFFFQGKAKLPRSTPLYLQALSNLQMARRFHVPLPVSRVDARIFGNIAAVSTDTQLPGYPTVEVPQVESFEEFIAAIYALQQSVSEDTGFPPNPFRPPYSPTFNLTEGEVEQLQIFAEQNQLKRSLRPLLLPDVAAPSGPAGFYAGDILFQRNFTALEFKARYKNHLGYAKAFLKASLALVHDRLWDPKAGAELFLEVLTHPLPTTEPETSLKASTHGRSSLAPGKEIQSFRASGTHSRWRRH